MKQQTQVELLRRTIQLILAHHPELAEDEDFKLDVLEGETDFHEVIHKLLRMAQDNMYLSDAAKSALHDIRERKDRFDRRVEAARSIIKTLMETAEIKKLEFPTATLYVRNTPQSVVVYDEDKIPDEFMRIKREPKLTDIKNALEKHDVPGASLSNGGTSLTIRKS
jgi:hypothetical protein